MGIGLVLTVLQFFFSVTFLFFLWGFNFLLTMRKRKLISLVIMHIMPITFCRAEDVEHAREDSEVRCGELYGENPAGCETDCGVKKYTVYRGFPCDRETNRNYGCFKKYNACWRSDADIPNGRKWCLTGEGCSFETDGHEACHLATLRRETKRESCKRRVAIVGPAMPVQLIFEKLPPKSSLASGTRFQFIE